MVRIVESGTEIYFLDKPEDISTHIEKCGRTCYKSENMITEETAVPFISGILKSGHESVIEHANVIFSLPDIEENRKILQMKDIRGLNISTEKDPKDDIMKIIVSGNMRALRDLARTYDVHDFLLTIGNPLFYIAAEGKRQFSGVTFESVQTSRFSAAHNYITTHSVCDVGAYKDITRHRLASFSIESTRFCNYAKGKFGSELTFIEPCNIEKGSEMYAYWSHCMEMIEQTYMKMAALGAKPDQLRMLLPHSTKADMIMSANIPEWKHIFALRCHSAAHPSVQQVMKKMLQAFYQQWPSFFADEYKQFIGE